MKQAKVISPTEMRRLLAVVDAGKHPARNRVAIMLSYYAGLRVGEIAALKISDVFGSELNVKDQIQLKAAYTKGNKARVAFVSDKLKREIKSYLKTLSVINADRPFLLTQRNTPFSPNTLCQLFGKLYGDAGIDGATSHSGRRSFITKLAHSGISPKVIMTLAGHQHLTTTQRYIDVNDEMMREAVEVI
ncbi:Integrase [Candidatus Terasakiella magnetica]|uniref:Integrase n=1 Tax=Candidatus Terasakiella magnetica TaxID=1867952 RepID=A0A1C3RDP9_9PROT|nr:site-specific integrase [Candidatus Terasakiella magnetica]SCA55417.1 Integrase [Candidatus Terasakiella magnetica]